MVLNQAFGLNPEKWIEEVYRGKRMDPRKFIHRGNKAEGKRSSRHRKIRASRRRTFRPRARIDAAKMTTDAWMPET